MSDASRVYPGPTLPVTDNIVIQPYAVIRSVTIANQSNVFVSVWAGSTSSGAPDFQVSPATAVTMPLASVDSVTVGFSSQTNVIGRIYAHVSDAVLSAQSSALNSNLSATQYLWSVAYDGRLDCQKLIANGFSTASYGGASFQPQITFVFSNLKLNFLTSTPPSPPPTRFYLKTISVSGIMPYTLFGVWGPNTNPTGDPLFGYPYTMRGPGKAEFPDGLDLGQNVSYLSSIKRNQLFIGLANSDFTTDLGPIAVSMSGYVQ